MKSKLNGRTSRQSLVPRPAPTEPQTALIESRADPAAVHAQVELVRVREEHKTLRTWAICGTIVAGMAIISFAAVQRHRQILEEG